MDRELSSRLKAATEAGKKAGQLLMDHFNKPIRFERKKDGSLVTKIDRLAEKAIISHLTKHFPDDNILGEESGFIPSHNSFQWIIDPLDGTHNYIRGIEIFGTSIGLLYKGKAVLGVIFMPLLDELYTAVKGNGSFKNGKRIRVSQYALPHSTMIYDSTIMRDKKRMLKALNELSDKVFNIRMVGSTARSLTYVAEGKCDFEVEFNDKIWDCAAGSILVTEAGGRFSDFNGNTTLRPQQEYIASNAKVYPQVLKILKKVK